MTSDPLALVVDGVTKAYDSPDGPLEILKGVSFELSTGHTLSIVGPSGSGKSTLLNIIGSLDKPTFGSVKLGDLEVSELAGVALARYRSTQVGFVFQDHHLLPQCTALENVVLPSLALTGASKDDVHERAEGLLRRVGVADRMHALPASLSGGERQRVAVARAMINRPPLLLCDEPTGNLDVDAAKAVGDLFVELASHDDTMLIVVTHNMDFADRFEQRVELRKLQQSA